MEQILNELLFKLDVIAPVLFLLFVGLRLVKRMEIRNFTDHVLVAYVGFQFIFNLLAGYLQYRQVNNLWVYHLNCGVSHLLFSFYFFQVLKRKAIVYTGLCLFVVAHLVLLFSLQPYNVFPSYPYALSSFLLVIYALLLLNAIIAKISILDILSLKEFWLVAGVLTYFGSAFLIFISYHYLSEVSPRNVYILWQVHNVFIALGCLLFKKALTSKQWTQKS